MQNRFRPSNSAPFFGTTLALIAAASVLVPACSGEDPAPTTGGPISIEAYRAELEKAGCELAVRCGLMPDQATCLDVSSPGIDTLQLLADVVYGTVTYDAAAARTCVEAFRGAGCDTLASSRKALEQACANVFKGTVAEGGACVVDDECSGDARCDLEMCMGGGACCLGKCAPKPARVSLGGDCAMDPCEESAYCDSEDDGMGNVTATCEKRVDNGQPCKDADGCLDGLGCDTSGGGTCYKLSKEGEPCNANLKSQVCLRIDNWCHDVDKKCSKLPAAGEPCTPDNKCLASAHCDAGTCKARLLEGAECTQMEGSIPCLGSLKCEMDEMQMKAFCRRPSPQEVCVLNAEQ